MRTQEPTNSRRSGPGQMYWGAAVAGALLLTVLALPAGAASKRKLCVQACGTLIAACAARNQDLGDLGLRRMAFLDSL